jgi:Na+-transporting methylmalonyl-CoA/oxaloacetate decarboxylase gamma subunit
MDDLGFGLGVALAGLGIVFGLLIVLWLVLAVALRLDRRAASQPAPASAAAGRPRDLDPRLAAAITVAIIRHTEALRRQAAPAMRSHAPGSQLFASHWVASGRMRQGQPWRRRAR